MKMTKTIAVLAAVATLHAIAVPAQDLFLVKFNATGTPGNNGTGTVKITQKNLIEQCVGTGFTDQQIKQNFALVYNTASDSIQVVNQADGSVVCDVFQFQGGTIARANNSNNNNNKLVRLTFVFVPDQADSVGSAAITEKPGKNLTTDKAKANLSAKIQFNTAKPFLTAQPLSQSGNDTNNVSGDTNAVTIADVIASTGDTTLDIPAQRFIQTGALATTATVGGQVFTGNFSTGKLFVAGTNNKNSKNSNNNGDNTSTSGDQSGTQNGSGNQTGGSSTNEVVTTTNTVTTTTNVIVTP